MINPDENDEELDGQSNEEFYDPAGHAEDLYEDLREAWLQADRVSCWSKLMNLRDAAAETETAEDDSVLMEVLSDILYPTKYLKQ